MAETSDPSLVVDRRSELSGKPGVHAILIGVSAYSNLDDEESVARAGLEGFRQPDCSALTAFRLMRKLTELDAERRLPCALKTLRLLVAPSAAELQAEPVLAGTGSGATRDAVNSALWAWRDDVSESKDQQSWFFFSGHAIRRSLEESILLLCDFNQAGAAMLLNAFRLSNIRDGMAPSKEFPDVGRDQFYFIDACRDKPERPSELDHAQIPKIFHVELQSLDDRKAPTFFSMPLRTPTAFLADPSQRAGSHGRTDDGVTPFGEALLWGLDRGSFGEQEVMEHGRIWPVTATSLRESINRSDRWRDAFSLELTGIVSDPIICLGLDPSQPALPPGHASAERLNTQRDNPARVDALGRKSFARILATRIVEAHQTSPDDSPAFMVHLHGPWGSGKSSVLNFVEDELKSGELGQPWLVIDFNAWKHQRLRPPWWSLIRGIYAAALADPKVKSNLRLRSVWWRWRLRADWLPILLVALVLGGAAFALTRLGGGSNALPGLAAGITAAAGVYGYARFLLFGSSKAAQTYLDIRDDPFGPVIQLLNDLVTAIGRPVIVFIDDLDRCDGDYVVELLEGIQTLQRSAPITYLVAADRKWICSSIEKKYCDFASSIGDAGRPLGYLFLDKMFQISVGIPRLSASVQAQYWEKLLAASDGSGEDVAAVARARVQAARDVEGLTSQEDLQRVVDASADQSPAVQQAVREQAAMQITSAAATRTTEHRLQKLAALLEPNPRAMKRLVNAVALAQASAFLEGRNADLDLLARWSMVELRWPILADLLAFNPELIEPFQQVHLQPEGEFDSRLFPPHVAGLCRDRDLLSVLGFGEDDADLNREALRNWLT
jgi:hypothetical protein